MTNTTSTTSQPRAATSAGVAGKGGNAGVTIGSSGSCVRAVLVNALADGQERGGITSLDIDPGFTEFRKIASPQLNDYRVQERLMATRASAIPPPPSAGCLTPPARLH